MAVARRDGQRLLISLPISISMHLTLAAIVCLASLRLPACVPCSAPLPDPIDVHYLVPPPKIVKKRPVELPEAKVVDEHHQAPKPKRKKKLRRKVASVLKALENLPPRKRPLKSLVSNIAAVRVPAEASSFRVSGIISKIPGGGVRLEGGIRPKRKRNRAGFDLLRRPRLRRRLRGVIVSCSGSTAPPISMLLVIRPNGAVKSAKLRPAGALKPAVRRCVIRRARSWRFSRSAGERTQIIFFRPKVRKGWRRTSEI